MQKRESGKSNLKYLELKVIGVSSTSPKHRRFFIALWLIAAILLTSASAQQTQESRPEPTPTPATQKTVNLWAGAGSEQWKQPETTVGSHGNQRLMNVTANAKTGVKPNLPPLQIKEQGSFAVGGTIITNPGKFDPYHPTPDGQTLHGDHAYVFYQLPVRARQLPLVMWHGFGQFSKTWETTADGREGYQNIFLRRGFGVYVIDQPRRGNAGRSTQQITITPTPDEQGWFGTFRLGIWPDFFPGVQFSREPEALNQYFRSMTPNTGPLDVDVISRPAAALFDKVGPGILVTHSHSGGFGWRTAIRNRNVRAIVSYEPGSGFVFPEGEVPAPIQSSAGPLEALGIPLAEFLLLTKIPIVIYYGDYIPKEPTANPGQDQWRVRLEMARKWRDAVNKRGGDVTVVHLPDVGIRGNTHFPFSDLNNLQIADLMSAWLNKKGLDKYPARSGRSRGL